MYKKDILSDKPKKSKSNFILNDKKNSTINCKGFRNGTNGGTVRRGKQK